MGKVGFLTIVTKTNRRVLSGFFFPPKIVTGDSCRKTIKMSLERDVSEEYILKFSWIILIR